MTELGSDCRAAKTEAADEISQCREVSRPLHGYGVLVQAGPQAGEPADAVSPTAAMTRTGIESGTDVTGQHRPSTPHPPWTPPDKSGMPASTSAVVGGPANGSPISAPAARPLTIPLNRTELSVARMSTRTQTPSIEDTVQEAGCRDGRNAAAWWIQDTIGGRANGDVHARALQILTGINDGDPAILDTMPTPPAHDLAGDSHWWADLHTAYTDGFQQGCEAAVVAACQTLLA